MIELCKNTSKKCLINIITKLTASNPSKQSLELTSGDVYIDSEKLNSMDLTETDHINENLSSSLYTLLLQILFHINFYQNPIRISTHVIEC